MKLQTQGFWQDVQELCRSFSCYYVRLQYDSCPNGPQMLWKRTRKEDLQKSIIPDRFLAKIYLSIYICNNLMYLFIVFFCLFLAYTQTT